MYLDKQDLVTGPFLLSDYTKEEALAVFQREPYTSLPVADPDGRYLGVMCIRSLVFFADNQQEPAGIIAAAYRLKPLQLTARLEQIDLSPYGDTIPFVDANHRLIGFMRSRDVMAKISSYYRRIAALEGKITDASYNGIIAIDNEGSIMVYNPAAERILGRARGEVFGRHISELDPEMGLLDTMDTMTATTGLRVEINGRKVLTNRTPLVYDSICFGAMSVFMDMSEYDAVCSQLTSSMLTVREFDAIFESSYDGFYIANHDGRVTRVNSAWERICGFPRSLIIGKKAQELVENKCFDQSVAVEAMNQKKSVTLLVNITKGPRQGTQVMATGTPIFAGDGNIDQIVVNVRDMTDLEQLRRRLDASVELNRRYASELEQVRLQQLKMEDLVMRSTPMKKITEMAARIAMVDSTVLVMGESGVGKEVITNKIHALSRRKNQPFIKVNCGAIPDNLLESELFGYAGGAFTSAKKEGKPGMFELAAGGTLFLDEIGELPLNLQVKLLRVLQEKKLTRIGDIKEMAVDVRVIAATNKDLTALIKTGAFREDLFYRLNVFGIIIPPLRERREDIPALLNKFLLKNNEKYGMKKSFSTATVERLMNYAWPGNVRELENLVERLVVLVNEPYIEPFHLPEAMQANTVREQFAGDGAVPPGSRVTYRQALEAMEERLLRQTFKEQGTTRKVAEVLGVNQSTIVRKMKQYSIAR